MTNPSTPSIIFDFGNVLIQWDAHRVYEKYFSTHAEIDHFLHEINFSAWNLEQDRGRPFAEGVKALSAQHPQYAHLIRAYHHEWEDSVPGDIPGSVEILRDLHHQGYPLYGLTNFSVETYPLMLRRFAFIGLFRYVLVSGRVGMVKPEPGIYHLLLEKIARPAGDCLFIDDSIANVNGAKAIGMDAIRFESPGQLREELARRGIHIQAKDLLHKYA